jgi:hypothetical protein
MTRHNMTEDEPEIEANIPDSPELLRRMTHNQVDGIRTASFRRLIVMQNLAQVDWEEKGPVWTDWLDRKGDHVSANRENFIQGLRVADYQALADLAGEYFDVDESFVKVSDRTAEDYLKTLKALEIP